FLRTSAFQEHALGDPGPSLQEFAKRRKNYRIRAQCALYRWSLLGFLGPSSAFDGYRAGRRVRDSRLHRRRVHRPIPALHDGESETLSLDPGIALSEIPGDVEAFRQTVFGGWAQVVWGGNYPAVTSCGGTCATAPNPLPVRNGAPSAECNTSALPEPAPA